ncbi:MAG: hypothetical protein LBR50_01755 [Tannerella sp.]|nr:hypothetical protein [Tannerella sp.]
MKTKYLIFAGIIVTCLISTRCNKIEDLLQDKDEQYEITVNLTNTDCDSEVYLWFEDTGMTGVDCLEALSNLYSGAVADLDDRHLRIKLYGEIFGGGGGGRAQMAYGVIDYTVATGSSDVVRDTVYYEWNGNDFVKK